MFSEPENTWFDFQAADLLDRKSQGIEIQDAGQATAASLKRSKMIGLKIFPDAEHVQDSNDRSDYRPYDPREGWRQMLSFLAANLKY